MRRHTEVDVNPPGTGRLAHQDTSRHIGGRNARTADFNIVESTWVLAHRDERERLFGAPLTFDPLDGKKASRSSYPRLGVGGVLKEYEHRVYLDWVNGSMERFRDATQSVRALVVAEG